MPVRNGGDYLARAVDSILTQTFADFEFVIVDDGSTDATPERLRRYQAADSRIRVLSQNQAGLVASLNRGCAHAGAEYIARMDADDIAFPERFARQVEFLDRHPEVALVGSAVVRIDAAGRELTRNVCPTSHAEIVAALRRYTCFTHPSVMLRATALAAAGGYRYAYAPAEDYDLWLRLSERYKLANLPEPLLYYRVFPDQLSVRQLDQQVLSVVGARAAAEQRTRTGADRTPDRELITAALLQAWGVPEMTLTDARGDAYTYAAYVMLQADHPDEAIALLRTGQRLTRGQGKITAMLAGVCSKQAGAALRRGRLRSALGWGIEAWHAQPSLPWRLLRDRIRRIPVRIDSTGAPT
jgi:cellulose synthase/poly-beta-1,6-N-acetylglucosamine synthase-like glycosyltransferase